MYTPNTSVHVGYNRLKLQRIYLDKTETRMPFRTRQFLNSFGRVYIFPKQIRVRVLAEF